MRHGVAVLFVVFVTALVGAPQAPANYQPQAPANHQPPPTITLLSPANGASFYTTGKNNPTFRWQITYGGQVNNDPMIEIQWSDDPLFHEEHSIDFVRCYADNPTCFTSRQPQGSFWYTEADTCTYSPPGPNCPRPKGAPLVLYWRVAVRFWGSPVEQHPPVYSPVYKLYGRLKPDRIRPRVSVLPGSGKRGHRGIFYFHIADDRHTVRAAARVTYHGRLLFGASRTFANVSWSYLYYLKFPIPGRAPVGVYKACVSARDPAGNKRSDCAPFRIR